ncbi:MULTISPECIES: asparagine synthase (glutamine-hydrolyzing) [Chryseobacterium]|jgi:asparagine synthase (glutamine-hydrolysing)|uniref:asparagine synthase (glutamine-hydrolyzing) n=1 Tax=Chryseobacterium cucumeris TaxID=1813611 RepID=A0ABX9X594_9FLAO|nr:MULTISPECIES: asparagine synthase (glutamine-hydrolyzing) [Chryseobacterium]MDH5032041.1 asparagine synthase (glutamine-hydrolyzing) [Chryseobacterium cucumeris]QWT85710.1 asparagine synthase (glutamine-hydrolyzing) [Chryseobacterium sp. PCH239]ROH90317.1 asparagine synthase (glutamine-hydrolyzing) [Chryseobacterium cucumeris]TXI89284.1 MAG: asparagine synthase (glutamine-hydrolyzing) [Chryseobacterium sp.]
MCGITGAIEFKRSQYLNFEEGSDLHNYIRRRGPDYYGVEKIEYEGWSVTLAHSRLAIIDLSEASNQPMISHDDRYTITFNGEIYNYQEIREELISNGFKFRTTGDTEVLLRAWECWGEGCLDKLNGMFVFGLFDKIKGEFYLVRDRFGVKPLIYTFFDGQLLFSSSIASVAKQINQEIDLEYCSSGIRFGFFEGYEDRTPFKNVKYLMPGSLMKCTLDGELKIETKSWYSLEEQVAKKRKELESLSSDELISQGKALLESSTKIRLRSDVPLAISLSGGVDSSSIAAITAKEVNHLMAFSYGAPDHPKSEGPTINKFAKDKNINVEYIHHSYTAQEMGNIYDQTMEAQESPFLGLSIIAQHEVYKQVKERNIKVLLGGQGGDEIFAGYRKFFVVALKKAIEKKEILPGLQYFHSLALMLIFETKQIKTYWNEKNRYLKTTGKDTSFLDCLPNISLNLFENTSLSNRQISDIQKYSIPSLLRYEDRNSMYFSIESRLPFMDYRLVEFALALPDLLKIKYGYGKWILREMMKKDVPGYILKNRLKRGFDVTQNWVNDGVGERIQSNILENKNKVKDFVSDISRLEDSLTIKNLNNSNILNEAIMLDFLIDPIKKPTLQ